MMEVLIGKAVEISGMVIEVVADSGENYECRNLTTKEPVEMKKSVIERAIRLGQAEIVSGPDEG